MNNQYTQPYEMSDKEAFDVCLKLTDQIMKLTTSNARVNEKYLQYKILQSEIEHFSLHYHGTALNDLIENIANCFNNLEKTILSNKSQYEDLYGKGSGDGYL